MRSKVPCSSVAVVKAATVEFTAWEPVGSGLVTAFVEGDMAAVKSATDAGAEAAAQLGEVVNVQVITRPHDDLAQMLASFGKKKSDSGALPRTEK